MALWRISKITKLPIALSSGNTRFSIVFRDEATGDTAVVQAEYTTEAAQIGAELLADISDEFGMTYTPNDFE